MEPGCVPRASLLAKPASIIGRLLCAAAPQVDVTRRPGVPHRFGDTGQSHRSAVTRLVCSSIFATSGRNHRAHSARTIEIGAARVPANFKWLRQRALSSIRRRNRSRQWRRGC